MGRKKFAFSTQSVPGGAGQARQKNLAGRDILVLGAFIFFDDSVE
ncbi:MAG TPA: hypothetical protein VEU62_06535 [Bryobacterales bacterium]|nr:hypothetical protein [Bryobacterales bacterium]